MANQITLLKDFKNGQGVDIDQYAAYPDDHDANYLKIENESNQQAVELNALQGGGAFVNYDLVKVGDPASPGGTRTTGVIGAHSYRVTINGDTTKLDVTAGAALIAGNNRVEQIGATLLTSPEGGAEEHFVAIDGNGFVSIQLLPGLKALDVASATWDGAEYTNVTAFENIGTNLTDDFLATIMFDGDAHIQMLSRPATGNLSKKIFLRPDNRLHALEQILQGITTDDDGNPIGTPKLDATWITTGSLATARGGTGRSDATVAESNLLVGQGTGVYALESGATLRTSLGLGTGDTPQFAGLDVEELVRGGSLRIDLTANGMTLADGSSSTVIEIGASDTLGFYGASAIAQPDVSGNTTTDLAALQAVVKDIAVELANLGLVTDSTT